jgi:hypothetical protein
VTREFRGATFIVDMRRDSRATKIGVTVDGQALTASRITDIQVGCVHNVSVTLASV